MKEGKIYRPSHNVVILKPVWLCSNFLSHEMAVFWVSQLNNSIPKHLCLFLFSFLFIYSCMYVFIYSFEPLQFQSTWFNRGDPLFRPHVKPLVVDSAEGHFREMTRLFKATLLKRIVSHLLIKKRMIIRTAQQGNMYQQKLIARFFSPVSKTSIRWQFLYITWQKDRLRSDETTGYSQLWLSLILSNPPLRRMRRRNLIPPQQLWKNTTDRSRVNICLVFCGVRALQCFLVRKRC